MKVVSDGAGGERAEQRRRRRGRAPRWRYRTDVDSMWVRVQSLWRGFNCRKKRVHAPRRAFLKIAAMLDVAAHSCGVLSGDALTSISWQSSRTLCRPTLKPRAPSSARALVATRGRLALEMDRHEELERSRSLEALQASELAEVIRRAMADQKRTRQQLLEAEGALAVAREALDLGEGDAANMANRIQELEIRCRQQARELALAKEAQRVSEEMRSQESERASNAINAQRDAERKRDIEASAAKAAKEALRATEESALQAAKEERARYALEAAEAERDRRISEGKQLEERERERRNLLRTAVVEAEEQERQRRVSMYRQGHHIDQWYGEPSPSGGMYQTSSGESSSEGFTNRRREESILRTRAMEEAERDRRVMEHRDAKEEEKRERRMSVRKAVKASELGRNEQMKESRRELSAKKISQGARVRVKSGLGSSCMSETNVDGYDDSSSDSDKLVSNVQTAITSSPSAQYASEPERASKEPSVPPPSWRESLGYEAGIQPGVGSSTVIDSENEPEGAFRFANAKSDSTGRPMHLFTDGGSPEFRGREPISRNNEVPPPPDTPPPLGAESFSSYDSGSDNGQDDNGQDDNGQDDNGQDDNEQNDNKQDDSSALPESAQVYYDSMDEMGNTKGHAIADSSEWVLVDLSDRDDDANMSVYREGVNDNEENGEDDEDASLMHSPVSVSNVMNVTVSSSRTSGDLEHKPLMISSDVEKLSIHANMLSPEQLKSEISKIKLAISSRKRLLLANLQTPSPLSWRQAMSENRVEV